MDVTRRSEPGRDAPRRRVRHIRLAEQLGEGGVGTVYAGFDEKLEREVAVKVLRGDRLDGETRVRFLAEARILSGFDHPNICRIYDYLEEGDEDYLVLELIHGRDLRQAADGGLDDRQKLTIAEQVAGALKAAHARGIVHRDLKPGNVMLTASGKVKVLDFGLARSVSAAGPRSSATRAPAAPADSTAADDARTAAGMPAAGGASPFETELGALVGTPSFMSPEQARGERVTPASDMYSYGLLLHLLFTGRSPYEEGLAQPLLLERAADADTLPVTGIDGETAALVEQLKAGAPEQRPTAADAGARLRHIRERPRRRRRWLLAAIAALAIAAGGVKYTVDLRRERDQAAAARDEAEEVADFLVGIFQAAGPLGIRSTPEATARDLLDAGAERVHRELADRPRVRARLLHTIGTAYVELELPEPAIELLEDALEKRRRLFGEESVEVAESLRELGFAYGNLARYEEAEDALVRAVELAERLLGSEHMETAKNRKELGELYLGQSRYGEAAPLLRRVIASLEDSPAGKDHLAQSLTMLADIETATGRVEQAAPLLDRALAIYDQILPSGHLVSARVRASRAYLSLRAGELRQAESLYRQTLEVYERVLGTGGNVGTLYHSLALVRYRAGDYEQAIPAVRRSLAIQEEARGAGHVSVAATLTSLAMIEIPFGEFRQAAVHLERALAVAEEATGPEGTRVGLALFALGWLRRLEGRPAAAESALERALGILQPALGGDSFVVARVHRELAALHHGRGEHGEAEAAARGALDIVRRTLGEDHREFTDSLLRLAAVLPAGAAEPETLARRAAGAARRRLESEPDGRRDTCQLAEAYRLLGSFFAHRGEAERAAENRRQALELAASLTAGSQALHYLALHTQVLLELDREDEARPRVDELLARGLREAGFLELSRQTRG